MINQAGEMQKPREFTGWHMAMIMIAFFGVIITVNGFMAYMASTSWTGLVAKNGYVASQDFNGKLAVRKQQEKLGYKSVLDYGDEKIVFSFHDKEGKSLENFDVKLMIGRPVNEKEDHELVLAESKPGIYSQKLKLALGQWNVDIIAMDKAERRYHRKVRLNIKQ